MSHQLFILGIAAATICVPLHAQIGRGTISGSVRDSSDAVVINAQVDVVHQETNTVSPAGRWKSRTIAMKTA